MWEALEVVGCEREGSGYFARDVEDYERTREIVGDFETDALAIVLCPPETCGVCCVGYDDPGL